MSTPFLADRVETRYALGRGREAWSAALLDEAAEVRIPDGPAWRQVAARWALCGHPDGLLLKGAALGEAERWAEANPDEVENLERDYLTEGRRAIVTGQRQATSSRMVNALLVVATIAALLLVRLWLGSQEEAERQQHALLQEAGARATAEAVVTHQATLRAQGEATRQAISVRWREAKRDTRLSEARALALEAKAALARDTQLAVLLAVEVVRRADGGLAPEASLMAQEVLYQVLGHEGWDRVPTSGSFCTSWASAQGLTLAANRDGSAAIWRLSDGARQVILEGPPGDIRWAAWSPGDSRLLTLDAGGALYIWDSASGARLLSIDVGERVTRAIWSVDGGHILAMSGGKALAWDALSGAEARLLPESCAPASAAWSPDGAKAVGADQDGGISVWQVRDSRRVCRLMGADDTISGLHWGADGRLVMGRDGTGAKRGWDAETGQSIALGLDPLMGRADLPVPGQSSLPVREADGRLYLALPGHLAGYACTTVGRNLTLDEWARYLGSDVPYRPTCPQGPSEPLVVPGDEV